MSNIIKETYYENGKKKKRPLEFEYGGRKYIATWGGKLIPTKISREALDRIFKLYGV
jgi:hypothetical protein